MSRSGDHLRKLGLTNSVSEDYGALACGKKLKAYIAYCTSTKCCEYKKMANVKQKNGTYLIKQIRAVLPRIRKPMSSYMLSNQCPDCGHAVSWEME